MKMCWKRDFNKERQHYSLIFALSTAKKLPVFFALASDNFRRRKPILPVKCVTDLLRNQKISHKICVSKNLKCVYFNSSKRNIFLLLRCEREFIRPRRIHWIIFHSIVDIIAIQRQHTNTHQTTNGRFTITEFYHNKTVRGTSNNENNEKKKLRTGEREKKTTTSEWTNDDETQKTMLILPGKLANGHIAKNNQRKQKYGQTTTTLRERKKKTSTTTPKTHSNVWAHWVYISLVISS